MKTRIIFVKKAKHSQYETPGLSELKISKSFLKDMSKYDEGKKILISRFICLYLVLFKFGFEHSFLKNVKLVKINSEKDKL